MMKKKSITKGRQNATAKPEASCPPAFTSPPFSSFWRKYGVGILVAAFLAVLWRCSVSTDRSARSMPPDEHHLETVLRYDLVRKTEIKTVNGERGLYLTQPVRKGELLLEIPKYHMITASRLEQDYPTIRAIAESILADKDFPNIEEFLTVIAGLLEHHTKGEDSYFYPYLQTLPRNVSQLGLYWTDDERKCVLQDRAGYGAAALRDFQAAFAALRDRFPPMSSVEDITAEWMFVMVRTRAFGSRLIPVLDLANHNAAFSVSPFVLKNDRGALTDYLVATQDWNTSDPVYNSYGPLSVQEMAEEYGFVDEAAAYVQAPSLAADMEIHAQQSTDTKFKNLCVETNIKFFGAVPTGLVEAQYKHMKQSTFLLAGRPTPLAFECFRAALEAPDGASVARYLAGKLRHDMQRYEELATAPDCQSETGAFPLIRQSNQIAAALLEKTLTVAEAGARGAIEYPGIPTEEY